MLNYLFTVPKFSFENIECNQHLQRNCQKNTDDTYHKWSADMKGLIGRTIRQRAEAINRGEKSFDAEYIETCRRNGINEIDALQRLCSGNPYTVEEIFMLPSS